MRSSLSECTIGAVVTLPTTLPSTASMSLAPTPQNLIGGRRHAAPPKERLISRTVATPVTDSANLAVGPPVPLFEFRPSSSPIVPFYSVSRDGQRFLLSAVVETEANAPLTVVVNWAAGAPK